MRDEEEERRAFTDVKPAFSGLKAATFSSAANHAANTEVGLRKGQK